MGNIKNKHHMRYTSEYKSWQHMKARCYNQNNKKYDNYGKRGITVCDRWLESFQNFYDDMGDKPKIDGIKFSLDRIDVNGNYCKENCRWATEEEQSNNKTVSHFLTFNDKTQTIKQWSDELRIPYGRLVARLKRGWSTEKSLTSPKLVNQYE